MAGSSVGQNGRAAVDRHGRLTKMGYAASQLFREPLTQVLGDHEVPLSSASIKPTRNRLFAGTSNIKAIQVVNMYRYRLPKPITRRLLGRTDDGCQRNSE